ncbi:MAG: 23S rRNA (uracil(1939)-C(5))-methyltransferase RlmD [Lachnospiraceae bacterium]|nr:23S rRNA (uracil(1939)-C(5))-methyltransferase RlmD [Lachnospiraceae bacterium]
MDLKKNDICVVQITDMNHDGEGIGKLDGCPLFIKDAIVGDTVRVKIMKMKKTYGYARLEEIVECSPFRVEPKCAVARQCGGCQLQAMSYAKQLEFKQNKVKNNIERIGKITDYTMHPIIGMDEPFRYRNKAQFPIGRNKSGKIIAGFYAGRTHAIIESDDCALGVTENKNVLEKVLAHMEKYNIAPYDEENHSGLVRHVFTRKGFKTGEIMVCIVCNGRKLAHADELVRELCGIDGVKSIFINVNTEKTNVILGKELIKLWGEDYITDRIGDVFYRISPLAFFQVNPVQTERLYGKALEFAGLTGGETVWDVYCGIGTISLFLAQKAKEVYGIEIVPEAICDAIENAKLNGFENTEFFVGKAEEVLPDWYVKNRGKADVVVVDPPRKGCEEAVLNTIAGMEPKRIVYVSCDSATLARDLARLEVLGYKVSDVQVVDMFPNSTHCETVCLLNSKK